MNIEEMLEVQRMLDNAPIPTEDRMVLPLETVGDFIDYLNDSIAEEE